VKGNEKVIFSGVALFVLALGFYLLVLSPKRSEVSDLDEQVTSLQSSIDQQKQIAAFGEQARKEFPKDYGHLVVLGKAVPDQADTASLMVQLNSIAGQSDVEFRGITLNQGGTSSGGTTTAPAPPAPAPAAPTGDSATSTTSTETAAAGTTTSTSTSTSTTAAAPAAPAPATEAAAASLPIGAVVGTAGLPTLPYTLTFTGGFFGIADYISGVDDLVRLQDKSGNVEVQGRLMTIDGFTLTVQNPGSNPTLDSTFALTSYVTPSTQGLTAGASPTGPAPGGVPPASLASSTTAP
jgi:Tfp pilus assembly protein PilO